LLSDFQTQTNTLPDVIVLSETWVSEEQLHLLNLPEYRSFIQPRSDGRRSGGVVAYVHDSLQLTNTQKIRLITGNALKLEIKPVGKINNSVTLNLVYRDCFSSKATFVKEIEKLLETDENNIILIGRCSAKNAQATRQ
jgi:hypothetical protein